MDAKRLTAESKWLLSVKDVKDSTVEEKKYDKIVVTTGQYAKPTTPDVPGIERFRGSVMHSTAYKNPRDFQNKRVLLLGFGVTAADTAAELNGHAKEIYLAHRSGKTFLTRVINKRPMDVLTSRRVKNIQFAIQWASPSLFAKLFFKAVSDMSEGSAKGRIKPEWNFTPKNSIISVRPLVSDTLLDNLEHGGLKSVVGIRQVINATEVELEDGSNVDVDAIIFCTGYDRDTLLVDFIQYSGSPRLLHLY